MYTLPNLPYAYEALEPNIDVATMRVHHDKHHQAYLDKFNVALKNYPQLQAENAEDVLWNFESQAKPATPADIQAAIKNHGGGYVHHSLFWKTMSPNGPREAVGELAAAISSKFSSFAEFKTQFTDLAGKHFGAGWAWLVLNEKKKLEIYSLPNQDSPLLSKHYPIMGIDVWEHAYYLKYQNRRPEYLEAIWNVLDWKKIEERYQIGLNKS
ncbi:superoxide dismutase [Patescibacteria group bacterium]|nr:superoxide dismutase [Patescibacteria group bacterium]